MTRSSATWWRTPLSSGDKELVKITVSARRGPNGLQIKVADNGPGIPPEEQEKIFREFYQVEKSFTGQVEGAGLGLALVKKIVELSGGKIGVESKLGEGTDDCYRFTLASLYFNRSILAIISLGRPGGIPYGEESPDSREQRAS